VETTARPASANWTGTPAPPMASRANVRPLTTAAACPCSPAPSARPAHRTGRFHAAWEQQASLRLRDGDTSALAEYDQHGRIRGGEPEQMTGAAAAAYLALTLTAHHPGRPDRPPGPGCQPGNRAAPLDRPTLPVQLLPGCRSGLRGHRPCRPEPNRDRRAGAFIGYGEGVCCSAAMTTRTAA